jgi:hypothetical protein
MDADYTEEVIKDIMLAGISDIDIRREVLGTQEIHKKRVSDITSLVESRESYSSIAKLNFKRLTR